MQQRWCCIPRDAPKAAQKPGTPFIPTLSLELTAGKTPSMSCSLGAVLEQHGQAGKEGIPVAFAAVTTSMDAPGKTTHPSWLRHRPAHQLKKPLVEETEAFLLLVPALGTTKPRGTATGSVPTGEGAGNKALSKGCFNKQEPVKSHSSQTLISV